MSDQGTSTDPAQDRVDTSSQPSLRPSARGRALILIVYLGIMALACALPALVLEGAADYWRGIELLVLGSMGLKLMQFGWFANVLALLALHRVMNKPSPLVIVLSALAFLLAMDTLRMFGQEIPLPNHEGHTVRVVSLGMGFYLWLLALLWPAFALMLLRIKPPARVRGDFAG